MKTTGNTILITGGTSGIGYELARQLLDRGNTVLITGRDQAKLAATRAKLPGVETFASDVSDPTAIAALYREVTSKFPALNVLINNAGIMRMVNLQAGNDLTDLTREISTNLVGPLQMVQQFLPHLRSKSDAAIVNVTSGLAFVPLPLSPIYCATKAALHSYTQSLRAQLKGTSVRIFELAPPGTRTPLDKDFPPGLVDPKQMMDVTKMVTAAIRGIDRNQAVIVPGLSFMLRLISRVSPSTTLTNKKTEAALALPAA